MWHRLQLKVLTSKEPPSPADVPVVPTLPQEKPSFSEAERSSANVPVLHPATRHEAAQPMPARRQVSEPGEEFALMDNRAIDKVCDLHGLLTDTLPERWHCTDGRAKLKAVRPLRFRA
jgi:hypothetical protein